MALAAVPFVPSDGVLVLSDGAGSPLTFTVPYEDGNLSFGTIAHNQKAVQEFLHRGRWYGARETDDITPEFTFTAHLVGFTDASVATLLDIVRRTGVWASATSTLPASAGGMNAAGTRGLWCVQLKWTGERSDFGGTADSTVIAKYCRISAEIAEGVPAKITITGQIFPYSTDYLAWT